jgi:hypothetical protein
LYFCGTTVFQFAFSPQKSSVAIKGISDIVTACATSSLRLFGEPGLPRGVGEREEFRKGGLP